jgi:hypothetical protein
MRAPIALPAAANERWSLDFVHDGMARELDRIVTVRGKPAAIVSDNGTELTSNAMLRWWRSRTTYRASPRSCEPRRPNSASTRAKCSANSAMIATLRAKRVV